MTSIKAFKFGKTIPHEIWLNAAWRGHVELILHLCQGAQNTLLIIGPKDIGKTALSRYLLRQNFRQKHVVGLTAQAWDNAEGLMESIAEALSLSISEGVTAFETVKTTFESYPSSHPDMIILIDDAHLLSEELLQALYALLKQDSDAHPAMHLILFGEPSLELQLFSPQLSSIINGRIYTIELEGWSLSDIRQYLSKDNRLALLSTDQISEIYETSQGLPGLVQVARDEYLQQQQKENKMSKKTSIKWRKSPIIIGALVGLIGGGTYIVMNQLPENVAQSDQITLPLDPMASEEEGQYPAIIAEKIDRSDIIEMDSHEHPESEELDLNEQISREAKIRSEANANANAKTEAATQANAAAISALIQNETAAAESSPMTAIAESEWENDADEPPQENEEEAFMLQTEPALSASSMAVSNSVVEAEQPMVSQSSMQQSISRSTLTEKEKYLLSLDSKTYTLQLVGARSEENVKQFMAKHGLEHKANYFKTKLSGKDWFVVVYGNYATQQAAKMAIADLPATLADAPLEPWVREISAVQADIKKVQQG